MQLTSPPPLSLSYPHPRVPLFETYHSNFKLKFVHTEYIIYRGQKKFLQRAYLEGFPKLQRHGMVQYGVDGGGHVVQYSRDVRHNLVYLQHHRRLLLHAVDGVQTLSMEWRPADEERHDHSNCNHKNRASLKGRVESSWIKP